MAANRGISIRAALGSSRRAVVWLIAKVFVGICIIALTVGFVAAIGVTIEMRSQLFGAGVIEPFVLVWALAVFLVAAASAICVPVLRATTIDPMVAMRRGSGE